MLHLFLWTFYLIICFYAHCINIANHVLDKTRMISTFSRIRNESKERIVSAVETSSNRPHKKAKLDGGGVEFLRIPCELSLMHWCNRLYHVSYQFKKNNSHSKIWSLNLVTVTLLSLSLWYIWITFGDSVHVHSDYTQLDTFYYLNSQVVHTSFFYIIKCLDQLTRTVINPEDQSHYQVVQSCREV